MSRDLTVGGGICLSKALLGSIVEGRSALSVYATYFARFSLVDDDNNLSCLKRGPNSEHKVRNSMFGVSSPDKDPAHFSFDSQFDVERLGNLLGVDIVIYICEMRSGYLSIFHDYRSHDSGDNSRPVVFYLTTPGRRNLRRLYKLSACLDSLFECSPPFFSEVLAPRTQTKDYDRFLDAVAELLELPRLEVGSSEFDGSLKQLLNKTMDSCWATETVDKIYQTWGRQKVAVVAYCRLQKTPAVVTRFGRSGLAETPKSHYFAPILFFGPTDAGSMKQLALDADNFRVVCLYAGGYLSVLSKPYVERVVDSLYRTRLPDKPSANKYLKVEPPSRSSVARAKEERRANSKAAKFAKTKHCVGAPFARSPPTTTTT